ncbi:hypothetical protein BC940DRAFT_363591 [Gongronella butleri]|nr:hypothetical protein BC940DRAFT_363591 [Gongronella butleri]
MITSANVNVTTSVQQLTVYAWVALAIFLLTIVTVIYPVRVPVPFTARLQQRYPRAWVPRKLALNLAVTPPLAVFLLWACGATDGATVAAGLVGSMGVQPYAVLILFYSLAYLCVSLDMTGIYQFLAFAIAKKANGRGSLAFSLFYAMTSVLSGLTSNDVVILTGTSFLAYFTRVSGILPTAFMMSEFTSANIASMALFIGNPTNVIVSTAFGISFASYSAWMMLPTLGGLVVAYAVLRLVFRKPDYIPKQILRPDDDIEPASFLIDRRGAYIGIFLLFTCLATLIGTSFVHGVSVWMVTLPFAVLAFARDLIYDGATKQKHKKQQEKRDFAMVDATKAESTTDYPSPPLSPSNSMVSAAALTVPPAAACSSSTDDILPPAMLLSAVLPDMNQDQVLTAGLHELDTLHHGKKNKDGDDDDNDAPFSSFSSSSGGNNLDLTQATYRPASSVAAMSTSLSVSPSPLYQSRRISSASVPPPTTTATITASTTTTTMTTLATATTAAASSSDNDNNTNVDADDDDKHSPTGLDGAEGDDAAEKDNNVTAWHWKQSVTWSVLRRLPWTVLPFSLGMFVLVEVLSNLGWTRVFASGLVVLTVNPYVALFAFMAITVLLCQLVNNLPATILLTRIIQDQTFQPVFQQNPATQQAVLLAVIAGSNLGACLTLVGSLAGIMFEHILRTKGIFSLGYGSFLKWNLLLLPMIFLSVACIIVLEIYVIYLK